MTISIWASGGGRKRQKVTRERSEVEDETDIWETCFEHRSSPNLFRLTTTIAVVPPSPSPPPPFVLVCVFYCRFAFCFFLRFVRKELPLFQYKPGLSISLQWGSGQRQGHFFFLEFFLAWFGFLVFWWWRYEFIDEYLIFVMNLLGF